MFRHKNYSRSNKRHPNTGQLGFTLVELLFSLAILLTVSAIVLSGIAQVTKVQGMVKNRTEMHANVRNATELLQQEIGQAGRISLPDDTTLTYTVSKGSGVLVNVSSPSGKKFYIYKGMYVDLYSNDTDPLTSFETVKITDVVSDGSLGTASFHADLAANHVAGSAISAAGFFATGIVPAADGFVPSTPAGITPYLEGSTATILKLYGDINGDGQMVYVEYTCVQGDEANPGYLTRNSTTITSGAAKSATNSVVLLDNVLKNPDDTPCFVYQEQTGNSANTYVTNVAVTLTVQTQQVDPHTRKHQLETKALLNVSPRNIVEAWQWDNNYYHWNDSYSAQRIQQIPDAVVSMLHTGKD